MAMDRSCHESEDQDVFTGNRQRPDVDTPGHAQGELFAQVEVHARSDRGSANNCAMAQRQQVVVPFGYIEHLASAIVRYLDWRQGQVDMRQRQRDKAMATRKRNQKLREQHGSSDHGMVEISQKQRSWGIRADDWSAVLTDMETQVYDRQNTD